MSFPPWFRRGRPRCAALGLMLAWIAVGLPNLEAAVVINELLYRPGTALPERTNLEFIELINTGPDPVALQGWQFTKGVSFTFPAQTLPAGGFVVVVADVAAFQSANPGAGPVVGGWTGNLSNQGEKVELRDAAGLIVDAVEYSDQGEWALRTRSTTAPTVGGWLWRGAADETGASLELRNPELPHDRGQNWGASATAGGTPGAANSRAAADLAPLINEVTHFPPVPTSVQPVTISCRLEDEMLPTVSATLFWRVSAATPPAFTTAPMSAAGDRFSATIPPQANNAVIEFYVSASDGVRSRTWPAPTNEGQTANALYQVSNTADAGVNAHYRLVMTMPDAATFSTISRNSDAEINTTLIASDSGEPGGFVIRYQSGTRIRGNSSRTYNPPPLRVEVPRDHRWGDIARMNLNTKNPYVQVLGMKLLSAAGLPAPEASGVKVSINGADRSVGNALMGGLHNHEEPLDGDFLDRQFPEDNGGNLYQKRSASNLTIDGTTYGRERQRWGVVDETIVRYTEPGWYLSEQWTKGSNESAADWSDLTAFVQTMHTASGATYKSQVEAKVNIEEWLRFLAALTLMNDYETNPSNGIDDDYFLYRGEVDQRFMILPHDLDTILGRAAPGDTVGPTNGTLFPFITTGTPPNNGDDRIPQLIAFIQHPEIRARYFAIIEELLTDGIFEKTRFDAFVNNHVGGWAPPATIAAIISWMDARRTYALGVVDGNLSIASTLPQQNGFRRTTSSTTSFTGNLKIAETSSVLVNGVPAILNVAAGTWSAANVPLLPGINRVTVQALDASGTLRETTTIEVWLDDGSTQTLTGPITVDTTLLAENGPFAVTGELVVNPGATLTINAGTNLWLGSGAKLTVRGALRMLGTEFSHVRVCPNPTAAVETDGASPGLPAGPPKSGGIQFTDTMSAQNLVQWSDLLHAQSPSGSIGVLRSNALLDHVTFAGTHLRMIYAASASLTVQNSTFPNVFAAAENAVSLGLQSASEQLRYEGAIPASGRLLIRANAFGSNKGLNAVLRLNSARRPDPIAQVIDNVFAGSGTNAVEIRGDGYVAGNSFAGILKDPPLANPEFVGAIFANEPGATVVVARNVFRDVDHAVILQDQAAALFENNTVVTVRPDYTDAGGHPQRNAAVSLLGAAGSAARGDGALVADSVFASVPRVFGEADLPAGTTSLLEFSGNLLPPALAATTISAARPQSILSLGSDNVIGDPHFVGESAGDFRLIAGSARPNQGAYVSSDIRISGEPLARTGASAAVLQVGGPGLVKFRYRLNGGAWSAELPIGIGVDGFDRAKPQVRSATITLAGLTPGSYQVEAVGQDFAGNWQITPTVSGSWTVEPGYRAVVINEVLAENRSVANGSATFPDLVELYNPGGTNLDLGGKTLSDDPGSPAKFTFPAGTMLPAGGYLVVYADGGSGGGLHLGFSLDAEGEGLFLFDDIAHGRAALDAVVFGLQAPDYSIGRIGHGATWALTKPTFGGANIPQPTGDASRLRINEWLAASEIHFAHDFIELYNPDSLPVALGGLRLSDEAFVDPDKFAIPALSFIGPAGFARFVPDSAPLHATALNFKLGSRYGWIGLFTSGLETIDVVNYDLERADVSQGRAPDGGASYADFAVPTPGAANIASGQEYARMLALLAGLRISEVMFDPQSDEELEFIELVNVGASALDLNGVRFTNGIEFTFGNVGLAPGSRILVVKNSAALRASVNQPLNIAGQWSGRLDNDGETIELTLPLPYEAAILRFNLLPSWVPAAAGGGFSAQLADLGAAPLSWNTASQWQSSAQPGGTPALLITPVIAPPAALIVIVGEAFSFRIIAENNPASFAATGLPPGWSIDSTTGLITGMATATGSFNITLAATNSAGTGTAVLPLQIRNSGPLVGLLFDSLPAAETAGVPFSARVRAVDAQGRTDTTYNAAVTLSGIAQNGSRSTVVLTECGPNNVDYVEIQNAGKATQNTAGWFVVVNNATAGAVNNAHAEVAFLPPAMAPGEVRYWTDLTTENFFGVDFRWPAGSPGWAMVVDATGAIRDFVAWEYTAAEIASINVTVNGFNLRPGTTWTGAGVAMTDFTATTSLLRQGTDDHHDASDWKWLPVPNARGTPNAGFAAPFSTGEVPVALTPTNLSLVAGVWSGELRVAQAIASLWVRAADAAGTEGESGAIRILADGDADGIADVWETRFALDPAQASDAARDEDRDGQTNRDEFRAGTDPRNPNSRLAVIATQAGGSGGTDMVITWASQPGRRYRVFSTTNLVAANWNELTSTPVPAISTTTSLTHFGGLNGAARFYRVQVVP